jgi:hypothetical protein
VLCTGDGPSDHLGKVSLIPPLHYYCLLPVCGEALKIINRVLLLNSSPGPTHTGDSCLVCLYHEDLSILLEARALPPFSQIHFLCELMNSWDFLSHKGLQFITSFMICMLKLSSIWLSRAPTNWHCVLGAYLHPCLGVVLGGESGFKHLLNILA